jgi:hypothetical protein
MENDKASKKNGNAERGRLGIELRKISSCMIYSSISRSGRGKIAWGKAVWGLARTLTLSVKRRREMFEK